jgi:hypothetical protein
MNTYCVCGYGIERHDAERKCPDKSGRVFRTCDLPDGKTCGECFHFKRTCEWLISCKPTSTSCDWYPVRFSARGER